MIEAWLLIVLVDASNPIARDPIEFSSHETCLDAARAIAQHQFPAPIVEKDKPPSEWQVIYMLRSDINIICVRK
jgi:hypothetical protein